jgi:hypothetical protein
VGRATVELTVEKADDSLAFVDRANGGLSKQGKVGVDCGRALREDVCVRFTCAVLVVLVL